MPPKKPASPRPPKPPKLTAVDFGRLWLAQHPDKPPIQEYHFTRPLVGDNPTGPAKPGIRERMAQAGLHDWRNDYAFPHERIIVEIDGGQNASRGGRHNTDGDRDKLNVAAAHGWRTFRFSLTQLNQDTARCLSQVEAALGYKPATP